MHEADNLIRKEGELMKLFGKVILALMACMVIGSAVSATAYVAGPAPYYYPPYPYFAPNYPVVVSESQGYVTEKLDRYFNNWHSTGWPITLPAPATYVYAAPHPAVPYVPYGIRTYPVYDIRKMEWNYVPYIRKPFVPYPYAHPAPGPVVFPKYWRQLYGWW